MANTNTNTDPKPTHVQYVGTADVREITGAQWKQAGADGQTRTVWDASNDFKLPVKDFSAEALKYFEKDAGFKLVIEG